MISKLSLDNFIFIRKVKYYLKWAYIMLLFILAGFLCLLFMTPLLKPLNVLLSNKVSTTTAKLGFQFKELFISGQTHMKDAEILSTIGHTYNDPLFSIDIDLIRENLQKNHWVKNAVVIRKLPDKIHISIIEKAPIALWQNNKKRYLIDTNGEIIMDNDLHSFKHLPYVVGEGANIYAEELIKNISNYPNISSYIDSYVRLGSRRWDLLLKNGTVIKMPESNFTDALENLNKLHMDKNIFENNVKIIDLRVPNRYYIEQK